MDSNFLAVVTKWSKRFTNMQALNIENKLE